MAQAKKSAKVAPVEVKEATVAERFSKAKLAFLYVLIGGLVLSALISMYAILIGEFNDVVQKALWTTFIFVTHSLLILTIVSTDKHNQLGRSIVPTVILGTILANMVTTVLGTWEVWEDSLSWRAFALYLLLIGSSFIIAGLLKLRVAHTPTLAILYTTISLVGVWTLLLVPWIFVDVDMLDQLYFRLVGALTILTATALSIGVIIRGIALSQQPALKATRPAAEVYPGGLIAVVITIGTIVAFGWFIGFIAFLISATQSVF